jgi:hypothetical protein
MTLTLVSAAAPAYLWTMPYGNHSRWESCHYHTDNVLDNTYSARQWMLSMYRREDLLAHLLVLLQGPAKLYPFLFVKVSIDEKYSGKCMACKAHLLGWSIGFFSRINLVSHSNNICNIWSRKLLAQAALMMAALIHEFSLAHMVGVDPVDLKYLLEKLRVLVVNQIAFCLLVLKVVRLILILMISLLLDLLLLLMMFLLLWLVIPVSLLFLLQVGAHLLGYFCTLYSVSSVTVQCDVQGRHLRMVHLPDQLDAATTLDAYVSSVYNYLSH